MIPNLRIARIASLFIVAPLLLAHDTPVMGRDKPIRMAGVELMFGMTTESVLAKYAAIPTVQVTKMGDGFYFLSENLNDDLPITQSLSFKNDRLSGLTYQLMNSSESDIADLIQLLHQALGDKERKSVQMRADMPQMASGQTSTTVELLIEDIEISLSTFKHDGRAVSMASVQIKANDRMPAPQSVPNR